MNPDQEQPVDNPVNSEQPQHIARADIQSQMQPQYDDEGQKPHKTKLSKKLIIIIVSVMSVLLIIAIAVVIYIATFSVDYKDAHVKSNEVSDSWNNFSSKHNEVSDVLNSDISDFDKKINDEKFAFDKFKTSYKKLEDGSMLRDGEVKLKYDNFVSRVNATIPKVETYLTVAGPIHDFSVKMTKLEGRGALTDAEIDNLVEQLVMSDNAKLKQFGQSYASAAKKMYNAIGKYNKTHLAADYATLTTAKTQFSSVVEQMSNLQASLNVVTSDDISQITIAWKSLNDIISSKYSNSK